MKKHGFFTIDALVAASVLVVVILVASSVMHAGLKMEQENQYRFMDLQEMENHLDYLMSLINWSQLDGLEERVSENITCSYTVIETDFCTLQLTVKFKVRGREQIHVLEKRGALE